MNKGFENSEPNKELRLRSWEALSALLVALALISWPFWLSNGKKEAARNKLKFESLAYQALELSQKAAKDRRRPASMMSLRAHQGHIGLAPDGSAYQYAIDEAGQDWVVSIWTTHSPSDRTEVRIRKDRL